MCWTPSLATVIDADELVHPVVVFRDGVVDLVGFGDHRELIVGVLPPPVVSDLQNAATLVVVAVAAENI